MILAIIELFGLLISLAAIGEWLRILSINRGNKQTRKHEEEMRKQGLYYDKRY